MVFDGSRPLVKRCDGFDGSLWSNLEQLLTISFLRSYMEGKGRGAELKQQQGEEKDKGVKDIMKSITNVKNDRAKKEQAKKWSNMPAETKGKVIGKWEEKAKAAK